MLTASDLQWVSQGRDALATPSMTANNSSAERDAARQRHLSHAPITEAVLDFRVLRSPTVSISRLEAATQTLASEYPIRLPMKMLEAKLSISKGTQSRMEHNDIGVLVKSSDEKTQAQFRLDGFTLNRLEPYTSWDQIYPETRKLWRVYSEAAVPTSVVRMATRYINRLRIPLPISDLRDYLVEPPRVPQRLPQAVLGYLTRIVIRDPQLELSATVTQSSEPNPLDPDKATILLDIDAFRDVPLRSSEGDEIDRVFNNLHKFKNSIFFNSVTQRASELFE